MVLKDGQVLHEKLVSPRPKADRFQDSKTIHAAVGCVWLARLRERLPHLQRQFENSYYANARMAIVLICLLWLAVKRLL